MIRRLSSECMGANCQWSRFPTDAVRSVELIEIPSIARKYKDIVEMLQKEAAELENINPDLSWSKLDPANSNSGTDEHHASSISTVTGTMKVPLLLPNRPATSASISRPASSCASTSATISTSTISRPSLNLNHYKDFDKQLTIAELSGKFTLKELTENGKGKKKKGGMNSLRLPPTKYFPVEPTVLEENMNISSSSNSSRPSTAIPTSSYSSFGQHLATTTRSTSLPVAAAGFAAAAAAAAAVDSAGSAAGEMGAASMYNSVPLSSVYNVPIVATPALPPIFSTYYPPISSTSMASRTISSSSSTSGIATTLTTESENTGASSSVGELTPPGDEGRRIEFSKAFGNNAITAPNMNRSISSSDPIASLSSSNSSHENLRTSNGLHQNTAISHRKRRPRLQQQPQYSRDMLVHQNMGMMQASPNLSTTRRLSIINTTERRGSLGHSSDNSLPLPSASSFSMAAVDTPSSATSTSQFTSFPFGTTTTAIAMSDGQISPNYQSDSMTTSMHGHIIIPSTNTWRIDKTSLRRSKRSASNAAAKAIQIQAIQLQAFKTGKDPLGSSAAIVPTFSKELGVAASQATLTTNASDVADASSGAQAKANTVSTSTSKKTRPVSRGKSPNKRNLPHGGGRVGMSVASETPLLANSTQAFPPSSTTPADTTGNSPAVNQQYQRPVMLASGYTGMPATAHGYSYYPPAPTSHGNNYNTHRNNVSTASSSSPEDGYLLPAIHPGQQYAQGRTFGIQAQDGNQSQNQRLATLHQYNQSSVSYPMQYQQARVPAVAAAAYGENITYDTNNYSGSSLYSQWQDSLVNNSTAMQSMSMSDYGGNNIVPTPYLQPKRTLHDLQQQQQRQIEQLQQQQIQQQGNYTYAYPLHSLTTTMSMDNASVSPEDASQQQWKSYLDDEYLQQLIYPQTHYEQSQVTPVQLQAYNVNGTDLFSSGQYAGDEQGRFKRMRL
jgi:hypothetical protein